MKVIVDTAIWSLALRRQEQWSSEQAALEDLIYDSRVVLLGPVKQEVLSGIRHQEQFERLRFILSAFPDLILDRQDYERAAEFFNRCRQQGIQGANTDFLICAAAVQRNYLIYTSDKDFEHFSRLLPITLYQQ